MSKKPTASEKITPFTYLGAINKGIKTIEIDDSVYSQFLINRGLSMHLDTVAIANEVNMYGTLTNQMHYDYLVNMVEPRSRFGKWPKPNNHEDVKAISLYYGYSMSKSYDMVGLFDKNDLDEIKKQLKQLESE